MRLLLDACVLFPDAQRRALLGHAEAGGFTPLWSARILGEWARAAGAKRGEDAMARAVAARMNAVFPDALVTGWEAREATIALPDPADAHVLAAALEGGADAIVTRNARDFPLKRLMGLSRLDPDGFLRAEWAPGGALDHVLDAMARELPPGTDFPAWLKRGGLPRLAKARRG